jgi:5-methylcytosine-specific restriction endonuclease McrA
MSTHTRWRTTVGLSYRSLRRVRAALIRTALANGQSCELCGCPLRLGERLHLDHVLPISRGGSNALGNVRVVHAACNLHRGSRTLDAPPLVRRSSRVW